MFGIVSSSGKGGLFTFVVGVMRYLVYAWNVLLMGLMIEIRGSIYVTDIFRYYTVNTRPRVNLQ